MVPGGSSGYTLLTFLLKTTMISRNDAKTVGLKRFFTGRPCKNGHLAERFVSTGTCVECAKNAVQSHRLRFRSSLPWSTLTAKLHPADHAAVMDYVDRLNMARGLPPTPRPVTTGGTPWEVFCAPQLAKPAHARWPLADCRRIAAQRGIPETYSPGVAPYVEWALPPRAPNFQAVDPDADGYGPGESRS